MAEFEKSVSFKNWSSSKFEGLYDGDHYKFEAGGTYNVPQGIALLMAKQLAVRELHQDGYRKSDITFGGDKVRGEMLTEQDVTEYIAKCFPVKLNQNTEPNTFERIDGNGHAETVGITDANKTLEVEQHETSGDDEDVDDEKNNAGVPIFKKPVGRPKKDAQYIK